MRARLIALLSTLSIAGCMAEATTGDEPVTYTNNVHMMPYRDTGHDDGTSPTPPPPSAPPGAHLTYFGGKVVQNAHVIPIRYGSGTYITQISNGTIANFYQQGLSVGVWDWLNEYNTTSPAQQIGRGSSGSAVQIAPAAAHNGSTIDDSAIQAELAAQIQAGSLPAANDNNIYMINFPSGKTITQGGSSSCVQFCAYHGTFKIGSQNVYYGVLPALTGGCATGCGGAATTYDNQTSVASHELIETVTDAEVGLATVVGPPLAWYDNTNGEIGDICNGQQGTFVGSDSVTYTIQKEFSNQQNDCITTRSVSTTPDFSLAVSPASSTVNQGASTNVTVSTQAINGSTQSINLSVSGLPSGVTGSFSPATVTAGGSSTLTLTASASASGSTSYTVTGTSGATTHTASGSLTVNGSTGGNVLQNGVPVTGISGANGSQQLWTIAVPAGQATLTVKISGGTGDADLYVKAGSAPTLTTYDCRPYITGNSETCTFSNPAANTWYVMLNGYTAYSGVTLVATYGADTTTALGNNVPVTNISGAQGSQQFWKLSVPAGQTQVVFHISGGSGDADLYVKRGSKPTTSSYDCRPYLNGTNETCTFSNPTAGDYYVMLRGYLSFSGVTLVGHYP